MRLLSSPLKIVILSEAARPHREAQSKDPDAARPTSTARTFLPRIAFALALAFTLLTPIAQAQSPLGQAHWIAAPFSTPRDGAEPDGSKPLPIFGRTFAVRGKVNKAEIRIAGLGQFEATIDGNEIGPPGLHQAWTDYKKTVTYETYDLTTKLAPGPHTLVVWLGNGMYNVQKTKGRYTKFEGSFGPPKLIAELQITYSGGHTEAIDTDGTWKVARGPVLFSSTYGGEDFDNRKNPFLRPLDSALKNAAWEAAVTVDGPGGQLIPAFAPEVQRSTNHKPIAVTHPSANVTIYDLGKNFAGIPAIEVHGPPGAKLKLTPGELLNTDGTVSQASSGGPMWWSYTLAGWPYDGEVWQPFFDYYGFRYIQAEWVSAGSSDRNSTAAAAIDLLVGIELHSASPSTGTFQTSNPLLNQIHSLILNAMHNNEVSIFTDCPTREKLGWLEQDHLQASGLMFNNDLRGLFAATDRNIADSQHDDGDVPTIVPQYTVFGPKYAVYDDSPEWGSAAILAPWAAYRFYGDRAQLALDYPVMQRYIAFLESKAVDGIVAYGLGDWYDIGPKPPGFSQLTTLGVTATLMLYEDADTLAKIATILNHPEDAARYRALAQTEKEAFNRKFLSPATGLYDTGSQTAQAMPLALGIVPESSKAKILADLIEDIRAHQNHTTSGEIGFPYELRALMQAGENDLVYRMLTRTDPPSYGAQIAAGATALTEAWDANPKSSQDHFMLGAAEEWFYRGLAGIDIDLSRTDPGQRIIIRPLVPTALDSASATYKSVLGDIKVEWHRTGGVLTLDVTVPVRATVILPNQSPQIIEPGRHRLH